MVGVIPAPFRGTVAKFRQYLQATGNVPDNAQCANCRRSCKPKHGVGAANHMVCDRWAGAVRA